MSELPKEQNPNEIADQKRQRLLEIFNCPIEEYRARLEQIREAAEQQQESAQSPLRR